MNTLVTDEITIGYDERGTGPALLLVHGHPFDRSMWQGQVRRFGDAGWRVLAPDLRGYGASTVVPGRTTLDTFAGDLAGLLDRLGIEQVVLGGLSMGGQIVLEFCRLFPGRLRGIVLAASSPRADTETGRAWRRDLADRLLHEGMTPYATEVLSTMVSPANLAARPELGRYVLEMMSAAPPEGAAAALRGRAERPDYVDLLGTIAVPALVVVGRADEFTPVAEAELMHERIPDSRLVVVEDAAHLPNLERPDEFDAALAGFLSEL